MAGFSPHGFIYILMEADNPNDYYKIGYCERHPDDRYKDYLTGNARDLIEIAVYPFASSEVRAIEDKLHKELKPWLITGKPNEWYEQRGMHKAGESTEWFHLSKHQLQVVKDHLFQLMQAEWKRYLRRDDVQVYATWGDNYRYGVLPVPTWLLERRACSSRPLALPEWEGE